MRTYDRSTFFGTAFESHKIQKNLKIKEKMRHAGICPALFFWKKQKKRKKCRAVSARSYCFLSLSVINCVLPMRNVAVVQNASNRCCLNAQECDVNKSQKYCERKVE